MPLQLFLFALGLALVYFGAEWLLKGAAGLVHRYSVSPLIVGATVVALGTSMPEFVFNLFAAFSDEDGLALGNIVGSNICNIALVLGASGLVFPLLASRDVLTRGYPSMMLVLIVFYLVALDGTISRIDGMVLAAMLIIFVFLIVRGRAYGGERQTSDAVLSGVANVPVSGRWKWVFLFAGALLLAGGAWLMVKAAVNIATMLGVSPVIIGLTVVAVGTSLPELATSLVGALKGEAELSVGNVLGSNILNVLFVVGPIALFRPLHVEANVLTVHFPVMLAFGVLLLPVVWVRRRIGRMEGVFLLTGFLAYLAYLVMPYL
ncbi:MAG: calcium/sodium antiporter [Bacteroidetes bacterium SB0662_bin_6]|nr:calcium/sodium antiporter [Bacteroidetes bacterium SB0668_bin_1]MYE04973.1 calcium/sodium antiporter [Bacteroidetes bacterium SB0662_bin_6]